MQLTRVGNDYKCALFNQMSPGFSLPRFFCLPSPVPQNITLDRVSCPNQSSFPCFSTNKTWTKKTQESSCMNFNDEASWLYKVNNDNNNNNLYYCHIYEGHRLSPFTNASHQKLNLYSSFNLINHVMSVHSEKTCFVYIFWTHYIEDRYII